MQVKSRARNPGDFLIPAASPSHGPQRGASGLLAPLPYPRRPPPPSPRQPPGGPSGDRGSPGGGGGGPPSLPQPLGGTGERPTGERGLRGAARRGGRRRPRQREPGLERRGGGRLGGERQMPLSSPSPSPEKEERNRKIMIINYKNRPADPPPIKGCRRWGCWKAAGAQSPR